MNPLRAYETDIHNQPFLQGGGEMGEHMRAKNWEDTALGDPSDWPSSLRTSVNILLRTKFPTVIFWTSSYLTFYNDAFRPTMEGAHPEALGMPAAVVFQNVWDKLRLLLEHSYSTAETAWVENTLIPTCQRDGKITDAYWTLCVTPVVDEEGNTAGLMVSCENTTEKVLTAKRMENTRIRFRKLVDEMPVATFLFTGEELTVEVANEAALKKWGKDVSILGQRAEDVFPELHDHIFLQKAHEVFESGKAYSQREVETRFNKNGRERNSYFDLAFKPMLDGAGHQFGVLVTSVDLTQTVNYRRRVEERERNFRNMVTQAPVGICIVSVEGTVVEVVNDQFLDLVGKSREQMEETPYWDIFPEAESVYGPIMNDVIVSGVTYRGTELEVAPEVSGKPKELYVSFVFEPVRSESGEIISIMILALDLTEQVVSRKRVEESEARFRTMVSQAPVAIALTMGPDLVYDTVNQPMLDIVDKSADIIGKKQIDVLPELKGQAPLGVLADVFKSGKPYQGFEIPTTLKLNGVLERRYYNISYTPFFVEGKVAGIIQVAADVTSQVIAKKQIVEAEAKARLAIESADLGTYEVNLNTNEMKGSPRFQELWGMTDSLDRTAYEARIHPEDLPKRAAAFRQAYKTGNLNYEARIMLPGQEQRWLRMRGKVFYDKNNAPSYLLGIIQDITDQKRFTEILEQQVTQRTADLEIKNRELKEINLELEQFTYAASHDMQEPLRKVHTFTSFLVDEHADKLNEEGKGYLLKIGISAQRMKAIMDDLLNYSQQTREEQHFVSTDLNKIAEGVELDLELRISQKNAVIHRSPLPVIMAVPTQMTQLFLNLYSNALKFSKPDEDVIIRVEATEDVSAGEISKFGLDATKSYVRISVSDNGIGFEPQYASQIFDLFKRLHTKLKYEGSGIGLGLCKKIVARHHGAIWAESEPNRGASFNFLLPSGEAVI